MRLRFFCKLSVAVVLSAAMIAGGMQASERETNLKHELNPLKHLNSNAVASVLIGRLPDRGPNVEERGDYIVVHSGGPAGAARAETRCQIQGAQAWKLIEVLAAALRTEVVPQVVKGDIVVQIRMLNGSTHDVIVPAAVSLDQLPTIIIDHQVYALSAEGFKSFKSLADSVGCI